jgi:hypothetical protein
MTTFARVATLIALALTTSLASTAAWSSDIARAARVGLIPPFEVFTVLRSMGFEPAGSPMLRGGVYVVRAYDDDEIPVRVTLDARSGRVLTVTDIAQGDDFSTPGRMGALPMPPDDLPAQPEYRQPYPPEYRTGARPAPNHAARPLPNGASAPGVAAAPPLPKKPAVAARTPTPKARPAETASTAAPATTGAIRESTKPGKSIPAPVARTAAKPASSSGSATASPPAAAPAAAAPPAATPAPEAPAAKPETPMVPVAPLE